uniref:Peptidase S1 domain-containing protein n=1 Tax=Pavo cristatus TaxID=9049 RepID=A0A8C9FX08_PAVCR
MLLRLDPPLTLTASVQPLPLPDAQAAPGAACTVMGYGSVSSPQ